MTDEEVAAGGFKPLPAHLTDDDVAAGGFTTAPAAPPVAQKGALRRAWDWVTDTGGESVIPSNKPLPVDSPEYKAAYEHARTATRKQLSEEANPVANDWIAQNVIGGVAGGAAGRLVAPAATRLLGPLARFATNATEGAVSSKVQGGDALTGALIGTATAVPSVVSAGAKAARTALRNPQGEIGRTIRALDEAKASGITKDPTFKALPKGAEGFNQAASEAEEKLASHNEQLLKQARKDYGDSLDQVLKDHADRPHVVSETHNALNQMEAENSVNGETINDNLAKAINKTRRMLTIDTNEIDRAHLAATGNVRTLRRPEVKVGDLMKVKRAVADLAEYGIPATPETRPYRIIDKTIARELETIDPRVAEMNKKYAATMGQLEESNDILYGSQNPDVVRSTSKQKRARGLLGRVGDSTQAATLARDDIERLKELDPAYKQAIAPVEAKKAIERTRFGLPHVSRRIEHLPFAFAQQNLDALGARVADPILGRLAGAEAKSPSAAMQLFNAAREQRRRDAEAAARLQGGM